MEPKSRNWTDPLSSRGGPPGLLLLDLLGGSPPLRSPRSRSLRSRPGERPLPLEPQFWSSVDIAVLGFSPASVGMLMPLFVGAISWDCQAGEGWEAKIGQVVVKVVGLQTAKGNYRALENGKGIEVVTRGEELKWSPFSIHMPSVADREWLSFANTAHKRLCVLSIACRPSAN